MPIADEITIKLGSEEIRLTPRLRHAIRLERRPGSFAQIMREVAEESLTAACDLIGDHIDMTPDRRGAVLAALPGLKFALVAYVGALTGIDPEDVPAKGKAKGEPVPFAEHLTGLYRIGTGWLGWTPAQTLDSTPAEIKEAYRGRMDMLKAIFGSGEGKPAKPDASDIPLDQKFKFIFRSRTAAGKAV